MLLIYRNFLRGIAVTFLGRLGVVLTTSSFITFIILEMARMAGIFTNQYMGLITYLLFPSLFVLGLALIPAGWFVYRRREKASSWDLLRRRFNEDIKQPRFQGSRLFLIIASLSLLNVLFLMAASARTLHFMDQAEFCGTACHVVMNPEWTVYQDSPHARVKCVECHVGEGVDALLASKLEGARQMLLATFNLYHRPIPTPVHQLRPARETCEKCHWPEKFYGRRLKSIVHYADDDAVTPRFSTLSLKVDTSRSEERSGIHWHVLKQNTIRYASVDDRREDMLWVDVVKPDGSVKRYRTTKAVHAQEAASASFDSIRTMDCVDCHNRATHIYDMPAKALDDSITKGLVDRRLPGIRRIALAALQLGYSNEEAAMDGIRNHIEGSYQRFNPAVFRGQQLELERAIQACQAIYRRNIHHHMRITWGTYPSHIGHPTDTTGCFRCHRETMVAEDGSTPGQDCTLCHSILAFDGKNPFAFLEPNDPSDVINPMKDYLRQEFMTSMMGETQD